MKKLFAYLLVFLFLCGCSASHKEDTSSVALTDYPASAFDITLDKCPQKVISLTPEVTDIIFALGSEAQLVGVSDNCVTDKELTRYGTSAMPKIDIIKEAKPDLVFAADYCHDNDVKLLNDAGIKVAKVRAVSRYVELSGVYNDIALLMSGEITGARNASNTFKGIDSQLKDLTNANPQKRNIAFFVTADQTLSTGSVTADLATLSGVKKLVSGSDSAIVKAKPDAIICPAGTKADFEKRFEGFKIYEFNASLFDRRGVEMVDGVSAFISIFEQ